VAELPNMFGEPIGNYDQLMWVQLARHRMALLGLEAGVKAVGAPLAVPRDVTELAIGPDSVIVTESPEKVRRVSIEVPNSAFALTQTLEQELRLGGRYPEGRATGMDASVITGQGVHALMGSFDAQIASAQAIIGNCLARTLEFCFETDVKVWPNTRKRVVGQVNGEPYDVTYTPAKDIGDVYTVDVSYGFAAGLSPNAAVVMLLQLRGDGLIDRSTVRRNMPFAIDDEAMQRSMDVEQTADALKQGLGGLLASLGPMAAQGMDPRPYLRAAAEVIQGRRNGKDLADLMIEAFAPGGHGRPRRRRPRRSRPERRRRCGGGGGSGPGLPGQDPNTGLPTGTVPGQAGMAPGAHPTCRPWSPGCAAASRSSTPPSAGGFRPHEHARGRARARCPSAPTPRRSRPRPACPTGRPGRSLRRSSRQPLPATPTPNVIDIHAPTQRPGEPVTHGADAGPGADSTILAQPGLPATGGALSQAIARAAASDTSGVLQQLLIAAQQRGL
jgi:hypothetical protein